MSPPGGFTHPYHLLPIPHDVLITAAVSVAGGFLNFLGSGTILSRCT